MAVDDGLLKSLRKIHKAAKHEASLLKNSPSRGMGTFPACVGSQVELSPAALSRLLGNRRCEGVLERTIVDVMNRPPADSRWFNQFSVAGGLDGANQKSSTRAIDLGRCTQVHWLEVAAAQLPLDVPTHYTLDLFELKEWDNLDDKPDEAALQLFQYAALVWALACRHIAPYERATNAVDSIRLAVMAPAEYFRLPRRTFRNPGPNNVFARFHDALESLKERLPELGCISFNPHAVVLEELDPEEFVTMFDEKRIQMLLDTRLAARRPTAVLRPNADGVIKDVVQKALADAHMG